MNRVVIHVIALVYSIMAGQPVLSADVLYWVDEQGQKHFSDRENIPPRIRHARPVEVKPNVVDVKPGLQPGGRPKRYKSPRKKAVMQSSGNHRQNKASHKKCESARRQLHAGQVAANHQRLHEQEQYHVGLIDQLCP